MSEIKDKGLSKQVLIGAVLMLLAALLVACGDTPASTSAPVATTTASVATTTSAAGNTGVNPGAGGSGGQGRGNFSPPISGTIESFDATAKTLKVKDAKGTSQTYDATNARVLKTSTITKDDLVKLATESMVVQVVGDKGSDGSYNATRVVLVDPATLAGQFGPGGPGGQFGGGQGGQGNQGQPPQVGSPAGNGQGQPPTNGTPGAGGGRQGFGGRGLIVANPVISGTTLTGEDFSGNPVTVNLSTSTILSKRDTGALTDLKTGEMVSVTARPSQVGNNPNALVITIGE